MVRGPGVVGDGDAAEVTKFPYGLCSMMVHPSSRCSSWPFQVFFPFNFFDELSGRSWLSGGDANLRAFGAFASSLLGPEQETKT